MAEERESRDRSSRDKNTRVTEAYTPPSLLPFPDPEPGYVFRYVATHILGLADPSNVSKRYREGWVPAKASDYPELMLNANANGNIEVGGLMLCKMDASRAAARDKYYATQAASQMESVDNHFMRNEDARMPLYRERKSSVERGSGFGNGTK